MEPGKGRTRKVRIKRSLLASADLHYNEADYMSIGEGLTLVPPATPQTLVRESVLPAALFIQQAGLASPAMSASPTSLSSHKKRRVDKRKKAQHDTANQPTQSLASKPNPIQ